MRKISKK
jgi:hypothetical protein